MWPLETLSLLVHLQLHDLQDVQYCKIRGKTVLCFLSQGPEGTPKCLEEMKHQKQMQIHSQVVLNLLFHFIYSSENIRKSEWHQW